MILFSKVAAHQIAPGKVRTHSFGDSVLGVLSSLLLTSLGWFPVKPGPHACFPPLLDYLQTPNGANLLTEEPKHTGQE